MLLSYSKKDQYLNKMTTCMEMILLVSYCRADRFDTSFAVFRLTMNKWRIKRLINLIHFNQSEKTSKEKLLSCFELNIAR